MWSFLKNLCTYLSDEPRVFSIALDDERVVFEDSSREEPVSFAWKEVEEIVTFKRDLFTFDTICLAYRISDAWHEIREVDEGFFALIEAMKFRFPSIPEDWHCEVMHPAFATCERVLWNR